MIGLSGGSSGAPAGCAVWAAVLLITLLAMGAFLGFWGWIITSYGL